jgi:hypothetical protein
MQAGEVCTCVSDIKKDAKCAKGILRFDTMMTNFLSLFNIFNNLDEVLAYAI